MGLSNPDLFTRTDPGARRKEQEIAYCADPFGNWTHLDPSWSELTGQPVSQCLARPMSEFLHPDDRKRHNEALQSLVRGEIYSSRHAARVLRKDGRPCWVEIFAYPTLDAGGRIDGVRGTLSDITDRRKGVRALRESEARLRAISEASPLGLYVLDAKGNCIFSNTNFQRLTGLTPNQLTGTGWATALHPDDRSRVLGEWRSAAEAHRPFDAEHRYQHADGTVIWSRLHAAPILDGTQLLGYVQVVEDVTAQRLADAALRRSRERLELALEGSGAALLDWDVPSGRVYLSERWGQILGGAATQTVTDLSTLRAQVHTEDRGAWDAALEQTLSGNRPFLRIEYRIRMPPGGWRWIETHARVVERQEDGAALRVTGTSADITERKDVERRQAEFVTTVSHELRTPLTSILGALDVIRDEHEAQIPAEARRFLSIAYRNATHLSGLVDSILDLERVEKGLHDFRYAAVSAREFLERAIELNSGYALKHSVKLALGETPLDAFMWVDKDRLVQVLSNLISNAVKFSPTDETVIVAAEASDTHIRILVRDRGPGVPPEFGQRIFQRFAQAETLDGRQRAGSGLGLSISKVLVERMAGQIGYRSEPGVGTEFYVSVPRAWGAGNPRQVRTEAGA
ncbi:MAG TPA: PAS domain S-box protein [Burkholderiales bacterium]|nr:PAS domain S-box protein [Burkholderiales bacterium]